MALPSTISGKLSSAVKNQDIGPFEHNGNLYVVTMTAGNVLQVMKSTDGGDTWTAQDTGNSRTGDNDSFNASRDGTQIAVLIGDSTVTTIPIKTSFSMTTDTYGTWAAEVGALTAVTDDRGGISAYARRDDTHTTWFYLSQTAVTRIMGTDYARAIAHRATDGGGTTTVSIPAVSDQANYYTRGHLLDETNGRVHNFFTRFDGSARTLWHISLTHNGSGTGTEQNITSIANNAWSVGTPRLEGSTMIVPFVGTNGALYVAKASTGSANPTWSTQQVSATSTTNPVNGSATNYSVAVDGSTIYAFWPDASTTDIWYDNDGGSGTWGTDTEFKDAITANGVYVNKITNAIGVVYLDGTTVKYDKLSLGATTHQGSAAITSASTVSSTAKGLQRGSAAVTSASTLTATARLLQRSSSAITSASTVTAAGLFINRASAAIASDSTLTATSKYIARGVGLISSESTLTANAKALLVGSAEVTSTSTVTANGGLSLDGSAAITSESTVTANAKRIQRASANVNSNSTLESTAQLVARGSAAILSESTVTAAAEVTSQGETHNASASITSASTVSGNANSLFVGSAAILSESTLTANGGLSLRGSATLESDSTVNATGVLLHGASAAITSASTLSGSAELLQRASATIASTSTVSSVAKHLQRAIAEIASSSSVVVSGYLLARASASIASASTLLAAAQVFDPDATGVTRVNEQGSVKSASDFIDATLPPSLVTGNLLIMVASTFHGGRTLTATGWTPIRTSESTGSITSWYRIIDGTEGATVRVDIAGGSSPSSVGIAQYTAFDSSDPIAADTSLATGSSTTPTATSVTTETDDAMLIQYAGTGGNRTFTPADGQSEIFDSIETYGGTGPTLGFFDLPQTTAGASGNKQVTLSGSASWATAMFSINAAPSSGGTTHQASAVIASASTIAAAAKSIVRGNANVGAQSTISASALRKAFGSSSVSSSSTVASNARVVRRGTVNVSSTSTVSATALKRLYAAAAINSASNVASNSRLIRRATSSILSESDIDAIARVVLRGQTAVASSSTVAGTGRLTLRGTSQIASESLLTARATQIFGVLFTEVEGEFVPSLPNVNSHDSITSVSLQVKRNANSHNLITSTSRST